MKRNSTLVVRSLLSASVMLGGASVALAQAVTVDGTRDNLYGYPRVWQTVQTGYGDNTLTTQACNGSELDAAYSYIGGGNLNLFFAGNLETNGNRIFIFLDTDSANGQNRLRGDNTGIASLLRLGDSGGTNGFKFESGFTADHAFVVNASGGSSLFVDYSPLPTSTGGTATYLGASALGASSGTLSGGTNFLFAQAVLTNGNTGGVTAGSTVGQIPALPSTGLELSIPLSALGTINQSVKVFAFVANSDGSGLSNQFLPDVGASNGTLTTVSNFGEPRGVDMSATGNPGMQFFYVQPRTKNQLFAARLGDGAQTISGNTMPVTIMSLTPGVAAQTASTVTTLNANGSSRLTIGGSATSAGFLTRSVDGQLVSIGGFDLNSNTATPTTSANSRAVATLDGSGNALYKSIATTYGSNIIRSAAPFNGSQIWTGSDGGEYYVPFQTGTVTSVATGNNRVANIFNNRLYASLAASILAYPTLPTATGTTGTSIGLTFASAYDFAFADSRTLYVAEDSGASSITKYTYNGTAWSAAYFVSSTTLGSQARALALGTNSSGQTVVYAVTAEGSLNRVVQVTDTGSAFGSVTTLSTTTTNYIYRGVDWSPVLWTTPTATSDSGSTNEDTTLTVNAASGVLANDTGELKQNATLVSNVPGAAGTVTLSSDGSYTYTPAANFNGTTSFTYKFDDGDTSSNTATVNLTVNAVNDAPTLGALANQTVDELATLNFTAVGSDIDGPSLTYSLVNGSGSVPAGASINPTTGVFSWTPTEAQGPGVYNFSVQVSDGSLTATQPVQVTVSEVNSAPTWAVISAQSASEGSAFSLNVAPFASDSDLPANTLSYSLVSGPSGLSVSGAGVVTWTPGESDGGTSPTVTVRVSDDGSPNLSADKTFTINVAEVNSAPTLANIPDMTVDELATAAFTAVGSDTDAPAQTLTYSLTGAPAGASIDSSTGAFSWTPTEAQGPTSATFAVNVSDGTATTSQNVTITVNEVNVAPVWAAIVAQSATEGVAFSLDVSPFASDSDLPANTLSYSLVSGPSGLAISNAGVVTWTPGESDGGTSPTVTVRVTDDGSPLQFADQTFTISVAEANAAPTWGTIPSQSATEFAAYSFDVSPFASDSDVPANTLSYSLVSGPSGLTVSGAGVVSWTPGESDGGTSPTVTVRVTDDGVPFLSTDKTFTIDVAEVNAAPAWAAIPPQSASEGSAFSLNVAPYASDSDLPANTLTYSLVSGPGGLTVSGAGLVTWTPGESDGGTSPTVTVRVTDNGSPVLNADTTFTINVAESNSAPTLAPIGNQTVDELQTLAFVAVGTDTDDPTQTLSYALVGAPTGATINPSSGAFSWTPTEGQGPGTYTFDVTVTDGTATASETITVSVSEVNVAPVWNTILPQTASEGQAFSLDVSPFASDSDTVPVLHNNLTFTKFSGPSALTVSSAGLVAWTPGESDGGTSPNVTVRVTDDGAPTLFADVTFTINVNESNSAPAWATIPSQSASEHVAFSMSLSGYASDADDPANTLTYELVSGPSGLTVSGAGAVAWTPGETDGGTSPSVTVRVTDNGTPNLSAEQTFTIDVAETNALPVAASQSVSTLEDTDKAITLSATDSDLPVQTLTYSVASGPSHGTLSGTAPNLTYHPAADYNGPDSFTFVANDGVSDSAPATVSIDVTPVNDDPILGPIDDVTVGELNPVAIYLSSTDEDGGSPVYSATSMPPGATLVGDTFSWIPSETQGPGDYEITFTVSDGNGGTDSQSMTIHVTEVNSPPTVASIPEITANELTHISFTAVGSDSDVPTQTLTYSLESPPSGATIDPQSGVFSWTPSEDQGPMTVTFDVIVSDGIATGLTTVTIHVNEVNTVPVWGSILPQDATEHIPFTLGLLSYVTDNDVPGNNLTFSLVSGPSGLTVDSEGVVHWTPGETDGGTSPSVTVRVTDDGTPNLSAEQTFTINVAEANALPVAASQSVSTLEDTDKAITLSATDSDLPVQTLTYSVASGPSHGTLSGTAPNLTYHPAADYNGPDSFTFVANDGVSDSAPATVSIDVTPVNDDPVLGAIGDRSIPENSLYTFSVTSTDVDGGAPVYSAATLPAGATFVDGVFSWTPSEAQGPGDYPVTFSVSDGNGGSDSEVINIHVNEVNVAPTLDAIGNQTVLELDTLTLTAVGHDTDLPANTLTYSVTSGPGEIDSQSGLYTFTPTHAQAGNDYSVTIQVSDGSLTASRTFQVHVDVANVAPAAENGSFTTDEDTAVNTPVVATDADNDPLTYTIVSSPTHGVLSGTAPNYVYTPFSHYSGPDSFTFKANDGTVDSNVATVSITVNNTVPMSVQVFGSSAPNAFGSPSWAGYRANALTSLENTPGDDLGSRLTDPTAYDVVTTIPWSDNTATGWPFWMGTLNPSAPFDGELGHRIHFGLRVLGNGTRFSLADLEFDMNSSDPNNDMDFDGIFDETDTYGPSRRGTDYGPDRIKGTADDIVYNTTDTPADTQIDELEYVGVGNAWDATQEPGDTPYEKTASMRCYLEGLAHTAPVDISTVYKIRPGHTGTALATGSATVTLVPTNTLPTAASQSVTVDEDNSVAVTLSATDPDSYDNPLSYSVVSGPAHGTLTGTAPNLVYHPAADYNGPDSFTFKASDCIGDSNVATVSITVNPVNDAPTLGAIGDRTVDEMVPMSITLTSSDIDGGAPVYSATGLPAGASISGDTFSWTPSEAQGPGDYSITFQVSDGAGGTDSETINIHVNEVNVAPTLDAIADQTVDEMTLVTFDADGHDSDLPAQTLSYSLIGAPAGASIDSGTGEFTWTPTEAQGPDSYTFTVRVSDGTLHADRSVTIVVHEANVAPTLAHIDDITVDELATATFDADGSDSDLPANTLSYSLVGAPTGATINPTTGEFSWTPTEVQGPSSYTFQVRVTDNGSPVLYTEQSVTITVNEVNVPPVAVGQTLGTRVNTPLNITLLATDSDLPANTLTYTVLGGPSHGTLSGTAPNLVYTPSTNYTGPDSFTFKANDGLADSNVETVNLNVSGTTIRLKLTLRGYQAAGPTTRGMTMFLGSTVGGANPPVDVSRDVVFDSTGHADLLFVAADGFLPSDNLSTYAITVKDNLHTTRKLANLSWDGTNYVATVVLTGGNINRDNKVDIADYIVYATQYGNAMSPDTPFSLHVNPAFRHSDISGDGLVDTGDFSFISATFGQVDDSVAGNYNREDTQIRTRMTVADAVREAGRDAAKLDKNRDGWISLEEAMHPTR